MKRELTYSGMGPMEVLPVELGGTGQSSDKDTINDFNMLTIPELNAVDGVLAYRQDGTIDPAMIPEEVFTLTPIHLEYETYVPMNTAITFKITDFDSWYQYNFSAVFGGQPLAVSLDNETGVFSMTTPGNIGQITFTLNGTVYHINVVNMAAVRVIKPAFNTPVAGSVNIGKTTQLAASAMVLSNNGSPSHDKSDWQVALDVNFTQLVFQSVNDTANKTSIEVSLPTPSTMYFARVRYHDAVYGNSPWSTTLAFTTKNTFAISSEVAKLLASDGVTGDYLGEAGNGYGPRGSFQSTTVDDRGGVIAASIRRIGSNGNSQGGLFIWEKQSGGWTETKKILSSTSTQAQSMVLTIPTGASITVGIQGSNPSTTTYTTSQTITIPAGTTSVVLTGKGQDGTTLVSAVAPTFSDSVYGYSYSYTINPGPTPTSSGPTWPQNPTYTFSSPDGLTDNGSGTATFVSAVLVGSGANITYSFPRGNITAFATYNTTRTTGLNATAVINGQTYTFAGGVSVPATQSTQTHTVSNYGYFARDIALCSAVTAMGGQPLALNIPVGGSITVTTEGQTTLTNVYTTSPVLTVPTGTTLITLTGKGQDGTTTTDIGPPVTSVETTGLSSTATINGQTYTFSGGIGVPAMTNTFSIRSYEGRLVALNAQSMNNVQFSYDLIFYKDIGNDWTVAKTFTNIGIGKASDLTFKFSKDGNTFVLSDTVNNRLLVYTFTADWNTPAVINLGTFGITLPSTLGVGNNVTVNADGTKIAMTLIDSASVRHFVVLTLSGGVWSKTTQYDFPVGDYIDAIYANDDLSVFAGIVSTGSYPVLNIYTYNGTTLTKVQVIEPPEADKVNSTFGAAMDISGNGNTIAVSSLHYNQSSQVSTALIHIFERQSTVWQLARSLSAADEVLEDRFGVEVDLSGDATTLVTNGFSGVSRNNRGAIYVFQ